MKTSIQFKMTVWIAALCSIIATLPAEAQHLESPALEPAVDIEEIQLVGKADRGNTFEILVRYRSLLDITGSVNMKIPGHVSFPGRGTDIKFIARDRRFTAQQVRTERFEVQANESDSGIYTVEINTPDAPANYQRSVDRWIKIHSTEDGFEIFDPLNPGDREPKEIGVDIQTYLGERPDQQRGKTDGVQNQSSQNYSVSVNGQIRFFSGSPEFINRGVYGNGVVLWFRDSSDPENWYHPVYAPDPVQGTHFDKLDEQGNFSFNFSFTGDLSGYDELIVLVNTANNAAIMPAPQDGYISFGNGYTAYFHESEGLQVSINPSQTNISVNQNGEVNSQWGQSVEIL
ncbi:MAG: hypothetical protein WED10_07920 [Brumimicrobium sp.]